MNTPTSVSSRKKNQKSYLEHFSDSVYERNATLYRIMANSKRLHILNLLAQKEMTVEELTKELGARKANVSQHLSILRSNRFVKTRRDGLNVFYVISDPTIVRSCRIFKELHSL